MRTRAFVVNAAFWIALCTPLSYGQEAPHEHVPPAEPQQTLPAHEGMQHGTSYMNEAGSFMMRQASGTAVNPASSSEAMWMQRAGAWNLMLHGTLFFNAVQQTGPRGGDKLFSTNWVMGMAERPVGPSSLMLRVMASLDPLTVTKRRYPLLFQTGELAFGEPIVDAQHPHDLVMEAALQLTHPLGKSALLNAYFAPVGDPALGPVAFPHRISAAALPQATLSHHLQDATHIALEVVTVGVAHRALRLEASGFHGTEPDENRWNIDYGGINSWSARVWLTPNNKWAAQASLGRLKEPEALEPGDIVRSTASVTYNRPLPSGYWATSLIWGRNHKTHDQRNLNSYLLESLLRVSRSSFTGRMELVDKDELFGHASEHADEESGASLAGSVFRVGAYTMGYAHEIAALGNLRITLGGNLTLHSVPRALQPHYGERPLGLLFFLRAGL